MTAPTDSFSMLIAKRYLAAAIRTARPTARQGNIFSPTVAGVFRQLIAEALEGRDVEAFVIEANERYPVARGAHPLVNDPHPKEFTHEVPTILLGRLPALSEHVEYRVVDYDLLLWDVHAAWSLARAVRVWRRFNGKEEGRDMPRNRLSGRRVYRRAARGDDGDCQGWGNRPFRSTADKFEQVPDGDNAYKPAILERR